jgi:hypothetical protein
VTILSDKSSLPEKVDATFWEETLLDAYSGKFCLGVIR